MCGVCVMEECGEFVYHAYVLQGGGGGDETVETGMKLTRSLQSGLEASLSMGSENGTTRRERGGSVGCIHVLVSRRCIINCNGL